MDEHDPLTHQIIGCAIEVHRQLGPGLLEATYERALCIELHEAGLAYVRQVPVPTIADWAVDELQQRRVAYQHPTICDVTSVLVASAPR